ncbi:MAG: class F sortase [Actinomycetota bacterium]|nr:class F sortase [Actinomycetota bacterium]
MAAPVGLVIPTLGIDGQVAPTGVNERAELDVPADARTLVWYRFGPSPGEAGSAVIAGHLDWKGALGTFYALDRTPIGEHITVRYDDSQRTFTVTESRSSTSPPSLSTEHSHGTAPACCVS